MRVDFRIDAVGQGQRVLIDLQDFVEHGVAGRAFAIACHQVRVAQIHEDAEKPGENDDHHQHESERVQVPAELESCVQQDNQDQGCAEIDVRRQPAAQGADVVDVATLADAEQHQPNDQQRADRAQRVAEPGPTVLRAAWIVQKIGDQ